MTGVNRSRIRVLMHLLFWLASISFLLFQMYLVSGKAIGLTADTLLKACIPNIGFALAVYVNLYVLIPRFLKPKNYVFYTFWLVVLMALASALIQLLLMFPFRYLFRAGSEFDRFNTQIFSSYFFTILIYIVVTSLLKFAKDWLELQDLNLKLSQIERQKLEAELNTLKGQINPHFLFNSLNNIYALALSQSEKVPDLILRLSDLMRHVIYESRENFINVKKEVEFAENFIALQRIRVPDKVRIDYLLLGEVPDKKIAPLLFEPLIDNAFKHGLKTFGEDAFVQIWFDFRQPDQLHFHIENSYEDFADWGDRPHGIGLENIRQRLKHLYQPADCRLEIHKKNQVFYVDLKLKLK